MLQGEAISPILWNIYLEDIVQDLSDSDTIPIKVCAAFVHILMYADDLILLAYTIGELQKKVNILKKYLENLGLKVNLTKTKFMVFGRRKVKAKFKLFWGENEIERVPSYTYLGVPFQENLSFKTAKEQTFSKGNVAMAKLQTLIYTSNMNSFTHYLSHWSDLHLCTARQFELLRKLRALPHEIP